MNILEKERGGERSDIDVPDFGGACVLDISSLLEKEFKIESTGHPDLERVGIEYVFSHEVSENSKFYPLDGKVPVNLYADIAHFLRGDCHQAYISNELLAFFKKFARIQAQNLVTKTAGASKITFEPPDTILEAGCAARPIYGFLTWRKNEVTKQKELWLETEVSFSFS